MSVPIEAELPRDATAAARARQLVADLSGAELSDQERDRATLLVSELATNAVQHGQGVITLRARVDQDRLLVEVIDEGSGVRRSDHTQLGGWGLNVVDAEASRWGVREGTTHVWFEIARAGPTVGTDQNPLTAESARTEQPCGPRASSR